MCISWKIKCWILLKHGVTMKFMTTLFHLRPPVRNPTHGASNVICCVLKISFFFVFKLYNLSMSKAKQSIKFVPYKVSIRLIDDSASLRVCNNLCVCSPSYVAPRTASTYIVLDTLPIFGGVLDINNILERCPTYIIREGLLHGNCCASIAWS